MTIDDFWKKWTRCLMCVNYVLQDEPLYMAHGKRCRDCKYRHEGAEGADRFFPSTVCLLMMDAEVNEW